MKQVIVALMLMGAAVMSTQANAQNRRGECNEGNYRVHGGHWTYSHSYRGAYYDCRPAVRVVTPAPVVVAPAPVIVAAAPRVVHAPAPYVHKPKVVIAAAVRL